MTDASCIHFFFFLPFCHMLYYGGMGTCVQPINVGLYLFDVGNAYVECRLDTKYPLCNMFKLFMCAVCQVEMKPGEGISIHSGSSNPGKLRPWDGPFLCSSCQEKKEAMEGKRLSGGVAFSLSLFSPVHCFNNL